MSWTALRAKDRPVVCEVGSGWAGFAYQFKTLFPRATYVLVDFPELFLFSATYLPRCSPARACVSAGTGLGGPIGDVGGCGLRLRAQHPRVQCPRLPLDLLVNMVSFQEMTDGRCVATRAWPPPRLSARLQPEPRTLALQPRAGQRERRAGGPLSSDGSVGARHRLHERHEEAAEARRACAAGRAVLPPPGRAARSGLRPRVDGAARAGAPAAEARLDGRRHLYQAWRWA